MPLLLLLIYAPLNGQIKRHICRRNMTMKRVKIAWNLHLLIFLKCIVEIYIKRLNLYDFGRLGLHANEEKTFPDISRNYTNFW